jgi:hypothetical protein
MNEIEQSNDGEIIMVPYSDNGNMRVIIIRNTGEVIDTLNVNEICGTDDKSTPIVGFTNPLVTACFNRENDIAVQMYHRFERKHYLFTYSWKDKKVLSEPKCTQLDGCSAMNFPQKTFFCGKLQEYHTFYRQG